MAVARPVRVLGLAAVFMWIFFIYTMFYPKPTMQSGGNGIAKGGKGKTPPSFEHDPMLDRK